MSNVITKFNGIQKSVSVNTVLYHTHGISFKRSFKMYKMLVCYSTVLIGQKGFVKSIVRYTCELI